MALGFVYGRDGLDDWRGYLASLPAARRFCRRFVEQHGSSACGCILKEKLKRDFDLADTTEALEYAAAGGPEARAEDVAGGVQIAFGAHSPGRATTHACGALVLIEG